MRVDKEIIGTDFSGKRISFHVAEDPQDRRIPSNLGDRRLQELIDEGLDPSLTTSAAPDYRASRPLDVTDYETDCDTGFYHLYNGKERS